MILYITSERFKGMLTDKAGEEEWEVEEIITEGGSLKQILSEKMQIVNELRCLVVEHSIITDSDKELEESIDIAHSLWDGLKVIMLEDVLHDEDGVIQDMLEYDNITLLNKNSEQLVNNMLRIIKGEPVSLGEDEGIWIGIVSSHSGAGATHTAFNLAKYLSGVSDSVCYVEANESGDLSAMAEFYGMDMLGDNHYCMDGIDYWHQSIDREKKYVVLDLGKYSAAKLPLLQHCRLKVVISDGKPYRIRDAKMVLGYTGDDNTMLWLNYADQRDKQEIIQRYFIDEIKLPEFVQWNPGLFEGKDPLYSFIMRDYIQAEDDKNSSGAGRRKGIFGRSFRIVKTTSKENVFELMAQAERREEEQREIRQSKAEQELHQEELHKEDLQEEDLREEYLQQEEFKAYLTDEEASPGNEHIDEALFNTKEPADNSLREAAACGSVRSKSKKGRGKKAVKLMSLLLILSAAALGSRYAAPYIHLTDISSIFNFQDTQSVQTATKKPEMIDERLNINPDIRISVMEVEGADGYEVSYSRDQAFDVRSTVIVEVESTDKAVESLDAGQTYYVRVRAFKFDEDGSKIYGEYTDVQEIHT